MANEVVKALVVELDGNIVKLRAALRAGEGELTGFATKAKKAGAEAGAGADVMASKQANAMRTIASATEMISRQGKISGEAAKQLIAQGSNIAFAFGPAGAIAGAIGIATVAIVAMFARTKEEIAETEARGIEAMNRFAEMDANAQARAYQRSFTGGRFKVSTDTIFERADSTPDSRRDALKGLGSNELEIRQEALAAERARAQAELAAMTISQRTEQGAGVAQRIAETQRRIQEVTAALGELRSEQEQSLPVLQETAKREAEVRAEAAKLKGATEELTDAEKARRDAVKELAREQEAVAKGALDLIQKHTAQAAELATKPIDDMIARTKALIAAGSDVEVNTALLGDLERLKVQVASVAVELAAVDGLLAELDRAAASGVGPTTEAFRALDKEIARATATLETLVVGTADYARVEDALAKLRERRRALAPKVSKRDEAMGVKPTDVVNAKLAPDKLKTRDMADFAREVQQAADGALQLAQNLGGAGAETVSMLRSIGQVAGSMPALVESVKSIRANAPGEAMSLGQFGGLASAALPILGALSGLFGGESAADKQAREELARNTDALRALTEKAGLIAAGISGTDATGTGAVLRGFFNTVTPQQLAGGARRAAREVGLDLTELDRIAASYGITLTDSVRSFQQLQQAIDEASGKLGEFGTDVDSAKRQADAEIAMKGITDPLERLAIRQAATAGRSAALDRVTTGLDMGTAEGRAAARANALALLEVMKAGGARLSDDDLGGLNGDQLLEALMELIESLNDAENASAAAAGSTVGSVSGFRGLTEATGSRLEDHNRALVGYARDAQDTRRAMLVQLEALAQGALAPLPAMTMPNASVSPAEVPGSPREDYNRALVRYARDAQDTRLAMLTQLEALAQRALAPLPVPTLPAEFGAARGGAAGAVNITLQMAPGAIQLTFHTPATDPDGVFDVVRGGLVDTVQDALYTALRRGALAVGDLRVHRD